MLAILPLHADERAHEEGAARSHYKVNQRNHIFMFLGVLLQRYENKPKPVAATPWIFVTNGFFV